MSKTKHLGCFHSMAREEILMEWNLVPQWQNFFHTYWLLQ